MKLFGKILAIWIFVIALMFPIGGAFMVLTDSCPMEKHFSHMTDKP
jgi:hypothetical protein